MPENRGRPKIYKNKITTITFKIDESYYTELAEYAKLHSLSVPHYVAMMMASHVNFQRINEANNAR